MLKPLLIHNDKDNTPAVQIVDNSISFGLDISSNADMGIDYYITKKFIPYLISQEFDCLLIKDSLSSNYLDLFGLALAYHVRLSKELLQKRFVPIVVISDVDGYTLEKIGKQTDILTTQGVYICENRYEAIEHMIKEVEQNGISIENNYGPGFLDRISVHEPEDYLSHHGIANEWSIYQWAKYLQIDPNEIRALEQKMSSLLYFKYLKAKHPIRSPFTKMQRVTQGSGKILYIDDEWKKGWGTIFEALFPENEDYVFKVHEAKYKDIEVDAIIDSIEKRVKEFYPDVVILDMRLHEDDFDIDTAPAELSGVKVFQCIKEINPGIQFVIFTASKNSMLLEELYNMDPSIVGYVKKEHPEDKEVSTQGNINKLILKIDQALGRKYLKEISDIRNGIVETLDSNPFEQFFNDNAHYEDQIAIMKNEVNFIFDILSSDIEKKGCHAMVSLATILDALQSVFIREYFDKSTQKYEYMYLDENLSGIRKKLALHDKIIKVLEKLNHGVDKGLTMSLDLLRKNRNNYIHSSKLYECNLMRVRSNETGDVVTINPDHLIRWLQDIDNVLKMIAMPKSRKQKLWEKPIKNEIRGLEGLKKSMS